MYIDYDLAIPYNCITCIDCGALHNPARGDCRCAEWARCEICEELRPRDDCDVEFRGVLAIYTCGDCMPYRRERE